MAVISFSPGLQLVFVAFDFEDFKSVAYAVEITCVVGLGFAFFPIFAKDNFLNTGFEDGVEIFALFHEDVFTLACILAV